MATTVAASNPVLKTKRLWQLLELALADLAAVEKMPGMRVDMGSWVLKRVDNSCSVCLAGAVMMFELPVKLAPRGRGHAFPSQYDTQTESRLEALDELRRGRILRAVQAFYQQRYYDYSPSNDYHVQALRVERKVWQYVNPTLKPHYVLLESFVHYDSQNPKAWWKVMRHTLKLLKAARL